MYCPILIHKYTILVINKVVQNSAQRVRITVVLKLLPVVVEAWHL